MALYFFGKKCTWSINYIAFQLRLFCDVLSFDPILNLRTNTYTLTHASIKHRFAVRLVRKRSLSQLLDGEESFQGLNLEVWSEQGRSSAALHLFLGSSGNMKPRRFIRPPADPLLAVFHVEHLLLRFATKEEGKLETLCSDGCDEA